EHTIILQPEKQGFLRNSPGQRTLRFLLREPDWTRGTRADDICHKQTETFSFAPLRISSGTYAASEQANIIAISKEAALVSPNLQKSEVLNYSKKHPSAFSNCQRVKFTLIHTQPQQPLPLLCQSAPGRHKSDVMLFLDP
ncbi:hypothetical protein STEG23_011748, partial [Scotinomys teguina]